MPVRNFNGSSDILTATAGGLSGMTYGTIAAIVKPSGSAAANTIMTLVTSDDDHSVGGIGFSLSGTIGWYWDHWVSGAVWASTTVTAETWYLIVARKATGAAVPRFSIYNFSTQTWTHINASAERSNWPSAAGGTIKTIFRNAASGSGNFDFLNGRIISLAAWSDSLPFANDAAIEAAGLHTNWDNWISASPSAAWKFDQPSTEAEVRDLVGTAHQSALTGTSVVTTDSPVGFFPGQFTYVLWPDDQAVDSLDNSDGGETNGITTATGILAGNGWITGVRFLATTTVVSGETYTATLWQMTAVNAGTLITSKSVLGSEIVAGEWNTVLFDTPVSVNDTTAYAAGIHNDEGRYVATNSYTWTSSITSLGWSLSVLYAWADNEDLTSVLGVDWGSVNQGRFALDEILTVFPDVDGAETSYFVSPVWTSVQSVESSYDIEYGVRTTVSTSFDIEYGVRGTVSTSSNILFDVRSEVSTSSDIGFDVRSIVSTSFEIFYDVSSPSSSVVSTSYSILYDVRLFISTEVTFLYDARESVPLDLNIVYNVFQSVSQSTSLVFDVKQRVSESVDIEYNISRFVSPAKVLKLLFGVRKTTSKSLSIISNVLVPVSPAKSVSILSDVKQRVQNSLEIVYDVSGVSPQQVSKTLVLIYQTLKTPTSEDIADTITTSLSPVGAPSQIVTTSYRSN